MFCKHLHDEKVKAIKDALKLLNRERRKRKGDRAVRTILRHRDKVSRRWSMQRETREQMEKMEMEQKREKKMKQKMEKTKEKKSETKTVTLIEKEKAPTLKARIQRLMEKQQ